MGTARSTRPAREHSQTSRVESLRPIRADCVSEVAAKSFVASTTVSSSTMPAGYAILGRPGTGAPKAPRRSHQCSGVTSRRTGTERVSGRVASWR